jgi:hypothetical protein
MRFTDPVYFDNDVFFAKTFPAVDPANTKRRTISFRYDGTNWVEISRAAADI